MRKFVRLAHPCGISESSCASEVGGGGGFSSSFFFCSLRHCTCATLVLPICAAAHRSAASLSARGAMLVRDVLACAVELCDAAGEEIRAVLAAARSECAARGRSRRDPRVTGALQNQVLSIFQTGNTTLRAVHHNAKEELQGIIHHKPEQAFGSPTRT